MTNAELIAELQKHPPDWPVHFVTARPTAPEASKVYRYKMFHIGFDWELGERFDDGGLDAIVIDE